MKRIAALILMLSVLLPVRAKCKSSFDVRVGGKKVTVYDLRVSPADSLLRMKGMDDKKGSKDIFEKAAFCSADIDAPALVKVKVASERGQRRRDSFTSYIHERARGRRALSD